MVIYQDVPEKVQKLYNNWKADHDNFITMGRKYEEYYFSDVESTGTTYNQRQVQNIKDNTNIPVSANFIYPIVRQRKATMVKKKPSFQIVTPSQDKKFKEYAYVMDKAIFSLLRNSSSMSKLDSHIQDVLIWGMSMLAWDDEDTYTTGQFPFCLKYYTNDEVILDAGSRLKEGTDMRGYFLQKEISSDYAAFKFDKIIQTINEYYSTELNPLNLTIDSFSSIKTSLPHGSIGYGEKSTFWRRFYDMTFSEMFYVKNPETGDVDFLFKENYFEDQIPLVFKDDLILGSEKNMWCRRMDILGDKAVLVTLLPFNSLPGKVTYYDWGGRPYRSYGMIHREIGKQDAIDKILQLLLMNGMLQNNAGWTAAENNLSPAQKEIWKQAAGDPRVIKFFNPVVLNDKVIIPTKDVIQPLSDFYPQMLVLLKNSMEYSTAHDPAVASGLTTEGGKIDAFSTLQQYQNTRLEGVELDMDQVNFTMEYLGNVAVGYILATIKPEETYTFLDQKGGKINEITIFKDMVEEFKLTKYKVIATASEAHPTQKIAMAKDMFRIAQTTQEPTERNIFVKKGFELLDMRGFDELAEELSEVKKLGELVQKMQTQLERDQELMKQYENAKINSEVKTRIMMRYVQIVESLISESAKASKQIEIDQLKDQIKELEGNTVP